MSGTEIRIVTIWSGWLRLAHWSIAAGALFLAISGIAMNRDAVDPAFWRDWHVIVGQLACFAVALRLGLLAAPGSSGWRALVPRRSEWPAIGAMLRFYVTGGKAPLPNWHAHNPLWKPVYLAVLLALLLSAVSGLGYHGTLHIGGLTMPALHAALAAPLALFMVAHLAAVFLHDLRGGNALVSAMIGGERVVRIKRPDVAGEPGGPVRVSLDAIRDPANRPGPNRQEYTSDCGERPVRG